MTRWDTAAIMNMLVVGRLAPDELFKEVKLAERELLRSVMSFDNHQILTCGWYSTPSSRSMPRNLSRSQRTCCLVFDGPDEGIIERFDGEYLGMDLDEFKLDLERRRDRFIWPRYKEGWTKIYYINTFKEAGERHLLTTLSRR